ncbi:hypothetical protein KIPB_004174 [Kipferlia bialata]|nr:hypothetical protein KIPB_004174 [Kipferlia bialata]|eukprot:g4174.t1
MIEQNDLPELAVAPSYVMFFEALRAQLRSAETILSSDGQDVESHTRLIQELEAFLIDHEEDLEEAAMNEIEAKRERLARQNPNILSDGSEEEESEGSEESEERAGGPARPSFMEGFDPIKSDSEAESSGY